MAKKVTIYDLAKELKTSASTVSRALQNHPRISAKTRQAVMELAEKMNYHPDPVAHHLRTGKGTVIGVIVPRIDRYFFASVIGGIESVAHEAGFSVLISQSNENSIEESAIIKAMLAKKIDGLAISLAADTSQTKSFESLIQKGFPIVFFDRIPAINLPLSTVEINNFKASYQAVQHLIDEGCRRIVHLGGPLILRVYQQRKEGYLQALIDNGIEIDQSLIIETGITLETGKEAARQILQMPQLPDAIFAAGDYSAMGVMYSLQENGIKVPQDIAVVGFANEPFDIFVSPPLSSIDQRNEEMGKRVAEMLLADIAVEKEERTPNNVVYDAELICRASSKKIVR